MKRTTRASGNSACLKLSDIDSDVYQGRGTTQAQGWEENAYVTAMKKRKSDATAFCDVEENLVWSRCTGEAVHSSCTVKQCIRGYNSKNVPPKQPVFMKGRKKDGSYKSQLEKNWEDLV